MNKGRGLSRIILLIMSMSFAVAIWITVLLCPSVTSSVFECAFVPIIWEIGFGLPLWLSDVVSGELGGFPALISFVIWPHVFATICVMLFLRAYSSSRITIRVILITLAIASLCLVVRVDYADKSLFQLLPLWHKYMFITF